MKAVMYGAGNIGRGFIGALFSQSGYDVAFVDVDEALVNELNAKKEYAVRVVDNSGHKDTMIKNVSAIDGRNADAVIKAIAEADIMATAVGVNVLGRIAGILREGIRSRWALGSPKPLNIIICENKLHADAFLKELILSEMDEGERAQFEKEVGLVEASIGRMVPVMTQEQKLEHPLMVCVEPYGILPVDLEAFKGEIPQIASMAPRKGFGLYVERKLFVHNCSHAICAYLGEYRGYTYIYEAMEDPYVQLIVENAMLESVRALSKRAPGLTDELFNNMYDLQQRFKNRALRDTCARVGADPKRKLSRDDRLIGAARSAGENGVFPAYILLGVAAGLNEYAKLDPTATPARIAGEEGGLSAANVKLIEDYLGAIKRGAQLEELFLMAEAARKRNMGDVI